MSRVRVYIKTFDVSGVYETSFTEVTRDVIKVGTISQALDNSEYDLGVFRNGSCKITMRNDKGRYSDPSVIRSIFPFKRAGSIVRVTWDIRSHDLIVGFFQCGQEWLGGEEILFEGLLEDVPASSQIDEQNVDFTVLGYESLLDRVTVPFADISNGDPVSDVIYACLSQEIITDLLTVDVSNITPGTDEEIDEKDDLENQTVREALKDLLSVSNSVLFIRDGVIYVKDRSANVGTSHSFYGQASNSGIENIIDIKNYRDGFNRVFNLWKWPETALVSLDSTSVSRYGVLKKELSSDLFLAASTAKIQNMLDSYKDEFANPKAELELDTPINYDTVNLFLKDRVTIDYPTIYYPADSNALPLYGVNRYGQAVYPYGQWTLNINPLDEWKILSRKIDPTKQVFTFGLRRI